MKLPSILLLAVFFFGCFTKDVFSASNVSGSSNSEEFQTLIQSVQEENLRLWGFVKDYQNRTKTLSDEADVKRGHIPKKVIYTEESPTTTAARHKRKKKNFREREREQINNPTRMRRNRRLAKKRVRGMTKKSQSVQTQITQEEEQPRKPSKPMKMWNFEIGVRNLSNNSADGFQHDHEIFHKLSRRIRSRHRVFVERKSVYFRGDGSGTFSRLGVGFQQFLRKFQDRPRWNPYVAAIFDHWRGDMEIYKGIPLIKKKDSKDVYTTRLGAEYSLSNSSNLDIFVEHGRNHLDFVDANGTTIELHARSNLYGFGILHEF